MNTAATAAPTLAGLGTHPRPETLPILMLGALGVVYGDIGTSPIYAFRQALAATGVAAPGPAEVLGLLSLITWALTLIVSVKYVFFVMRANNNGEGGILALMSLARAKFPGQPAWILWAGIVGAALFLADSAITPAISVLSAVEGLGSIAPSLTRFVLPATVAILLALFAVQRFGTARVSSVFGPVVIVWFLALALSGLVHIVQQPVVLLALSPTHGIAFLVTNWAIAAVTVGAIFLAVTGAEALYADMGHFGRRPIALAWFVLVFPSLLINYFGQGAFVLGGTPEAATDPFFLMNPDWARIPMVIIATAATVIASQAVISGAYSLVQQAMALNVLPRMTLLHTSETQSGQIYLPQVNTLLLVAVLALVLGFGSSSALSSAYGIAVSGVMLLTTLLIAIVMWQVWRWRPVLVVALMAPFILIDLGFVLANLGKFADGGWAPALLAALVIGIVAIWIGGRRRLTARTRREEVDLPFLIENLTRKSPPLVPGTAIFLTSQSDQAPAALLHSLKHYKVLHERNAILTVTTANVPRIPEGERVVVEALSPLFSRIELRFGFSETPDIPKALALARRHGWNFEAMSTSYFLSRRTLKPQRGGVLAGFADRLFVRLTRNAADATAYFHIPTSRVVEIGAQVLL